MNVIKPRRIIYPVETLGGLETFSFGIYSAGQTIKLKWNYCPVAVWLSLIDLEDDDVSKVFSPGNGHTYNVQILSLNGEYFVDTIATAVWRKNVELVLIVESVAT
jgi:hypothetical protein